ncbi:MAG: N-acetyl-gamma-glutamyl-phosphate reductase [Myxococcota bacterium]
MAPKVFVDGHVGTVGLRIHQELAARSDVLLLTLDEGRRKDPVARRECLAEADVAVLCLPDESAREAAGWAEEAGTRLVDGSTAHRVAEGWVYGLPELASGQRGAISSAARVTNPGCYATAFVLALRPLIDAGLLSADGTFTVHALSGYTGGGRRLVERWEDAAGGLLELPYEAPYALDRVHKHIPEMIRYGGLGREPQFVPAVGPFARGMRVEIPLHADLLAAGVTAKALWEVLADRYRAESFVRVTSFEDPAATDERSFDPQACNGTNRIDLHVLAHPSGHVLLVAILDNLGKGASGAALQNLNLMLGFEEGCWLHG